MNLAKAALADEKQAKEELFAMSLANDVYLNSPRASMVAETPRRKKMGQMSSQMNQCEAGLDNLMRKLEAKKAKRMHDLAALEAIVNRLSPQKVVTAAEEDSSESMTDTEDSPSQFSSSHIRSPKI